MHASLADDDDFVAASSARRTPRPASSHPNVVAVFDPGDDDGTLFLVMEHVPGRTLRDLIREEAADVAAPGARRSSSRCSRRWRAAHAAGLMHRDVKPENVLIADDGRVKVADFGLARAFDAETQHTATGGVLIGTVSYLSPELVVNGKADPRSTSTPPASCCYEMLTGRKPPRPTARSRSPSSTSTRTSRPPRRAPGLPPYVDALVPRATARDPDRRPADARVLLHQVRRVRNAVDPGEVDDPELTADLTPTTPLGGGRTPTGEALPARSSSRRSSSSWPGTTGTTTGRAPSRTRRPPTAPVLRRRPPSRRTSHSAAGPPPLPPRQGETPSSCCCSPCWPASAAGTSASRATPPLPAC